SDPDRDAERDSGLHVDDLLHFFQVTLTVNSSPPPHLPGAGYAEPHLLDGTMSDGLRRVTRREGAVDHAAARHAHQQTNLRSVRRQHIVRRGHPTCFPGHASIVEQNDAVGYFFGRHFAAWPSYGKKRVDKQHGGSENLG